MKKNGFTLIELLLVIGIMGLMGTAAVGGYRAMQRGMEERGVMQNVNQFIRSAYQRAQMDRTFVAVYFWNETIREETEDDPLIVVGKAVAVRRAGRISALQGSYLMDEFGDLRYQRLSLDEVTETGTQESGNADTGIYLYPMNGTRDGSSMTRSIVYQNAVKTDLGLTLSSYPQDQGMAKVEVYSFELKDPGGVTWKVGDAYGFEFAEIQLPHNFIFGTSFSRSQSTPVTEVAKLLFKPGENTGSGSSGGTTGAATIQVSNLRPGQSGELTAETVDTSDDPTGDL